MIECNDIKLKLGKNDILKGVSLTAKPGDITVLLGKNGSGKTTLLKCISQIQAKYTGSVKIMGHKARNLTSQALAKQVSLLPQIMPRPAITVEALARFGRQPYAGSFGTLSQNDIDAVNRAMAKTGMEKFKNSLVCHLSGGERQLAYFTMLIAREAPVILLDEPTASLDVSYRQLVYAFLRELKKEGRTILITMHDLSDAMELADKVYVLKNGENRFEGTAHEFMESCVPETEFGLTPLWVKDKKGESFPVFRPIKNKEDEG